MSSSIRIGISGHRFLRNPEVISACLAMVFDAVRMAFPGRPLELLSGLAEGSDRLAAHCFVEERRGKLTAVLPLPEGEYRRDFHRPGSLDEFDNLLRRCRRVEHMPPAASRQEAYWLAGQWIVENCDLLVVVWDGQPSRGRGGTGDVAQMARAAGRALAWIQPGVEETGIGMINYERFPPAR